MAQPASDGHRVWVGGWRVETCGGRHILQADMDGARLDLELNSANTRPDVRHSPTRDGFRKSDRHVTAYVSQTRLAAMGHLAVDGSRLDVTGEAWFDHEAGCPGLGSDVSGWDWFAIQFEDAGELMVYGLRDHHGALTPHACATWVSRDGDIRRYVADNVRLEPLEWWESPATGSAYATVWRLTLGGDDAVLMVRACIRCCEIDARGSAGIIYWDGPATVQGTWQDAPVTGRAYIEQVARHQRGKVGVFDFGTSSIGLLGWLAAEFWLRRHGAGRMMEDRNGCTAIPI